MTAPLDFYFAFGSPPGYFAAHRIDALAARHGREVVWHALDLREVFAEEGLKPTIAYPRKGAYHRRDWARTARLHEIPFAGPPAGAQSPSPVGGLLFYWFADRGGADAAKAFTRTAMQAYFAEQLPTARPEVMAEIVRACGEDPEAARSALDDPAWRDRLARESRAAADAGVWGSPHIVVDGEPFWGHDRLEQVDLWLERGGW